MFIAYLAVAALTSATNSFYAVGDFLRLNWVVENLDRMGVPRSWLFPLGALKAAGAIGILVGIAVPVIGEAATAGLVLFFVGAMITHARAHAEAFTYAYPGTLLLLATGSLLLRLLSS